jgi:transcription elongation factor GreA-like protein
MNRLWNRLVEIEQEHIKKYRQLVTSDEQLRRLETRLAEYRAKKEAVIKERKALRQKARAKLETHLLDEQITRVLPILSSN